MSPDLEFSKNEDRFKELVFQLERRAKKVKLGGGDEKNRRPAPERKAFRT